MKRILPIILSFILIYGCDQKINQIPVEVEAMRASTLYTPDSVYSFLQRATSKHKEIALNFATRSKELESQDPERSLYLQKRAISLYPDHEGYQRLGMMLKKAGNFEEASELYSFLLQRQYNRGATSDTGIYIFSKPGVDEYYNYIASHIAKSRYVDQYMIYDAKENGIDIQEIRRRLMEDEYLRFDKSSAAFKNIMVNFWTDEEIKNYRQSHEAFNVFLNSAKDSLSTYRITADNVADFDYSGIDEMGIQPAGLSDFNEYFLEESKEQEDFYSLFNLNHSFKTSDGYHVMAYSLDSSVRGCIKDLRNIAHKLAVYDNKGQVAESLVIGLQSESALITADIDFPKVELKYFTRNWKNPVIKGQLENELSAVEFYRKEVYEFRDGKFEQLEDL